MFHVTAVDNESPAPLVSSVVESRPPAPRGPATQRLAALEAAASQELAALRAQRPAAGVAHDWQAALIGWELGLEVPVGID